MRPVRGFMRLRHKCLARMIGSFCLLCGHHGRQLDSVCLVELIEGAYNGSGRFLRYLMSRSAVAVIQFGPIPGSYSTYSEDANFFLRMPQRKVGSRGTRVGWNRQSSGVVSRTCYSNPIFSINASLMAEERWRCRRATTKMRVRNRASGGGLRPRVKHPRSYVSRNHPTEPSSSIGCGSCSFVWPHNNLIRCAGLGHTLTRHDPARGHLPGSSCAWHLHGSSACCRDRYGCIPMGRWTRLVLFHAAVKWSYPQQQGLII
jgi:hypothetical protein